MVGRLQANFSNDFFFLQMLCLTTLRVHEDVCVLIFLSIPLSVYNRFKEQDCS